MMALAKLLAQKQRLINRLEEVSASNERSDIKHFPAKIDEELNLLDKAGAGGR